MGVVRIDRMPRTSDFGGHASDRGHGVYRAVKNKNHLSFFCLSCGKRCLLHPKTIGRASGIHCSKCGGPLEETDTSFKRRTGLTKTQAAKLMQSEYADDKPHECRFCFKRFRSLAARDLHIKEQHEEF